VWGLAGRESSLVQRALQPLCLSMPRLPPTIKRGRQERGNEPLADLLSAAPDPAFARPKLLDPARFRRLSVPFLDCVSTILNPNEDPSWH